MFRLFVRGAHEWKKRHKFIAHLMDFKLRSSKPYTRLYEYTHQS